MKKRIALLLAAAMLTGILSGCAQPPAAQTDPAQQTDPPSSAEPNQADSIYAPTRGRNWSSSATPDTKRIG